MRVAMLGLIGVLCAGSHRAYAEDPCGAPPVNVSLTSSYREAWRNAYCETSGMSVGATIPVEGVPVDFSVGGTSNTCTNASHSINSELETLSTYLSNDASLLVAECGYRMCKLSQASGADKTALALLGEVCTGRGRSSSSGGVYLDTNVIDVIWDGKDKLIPLRIHNGNPGAEVSVQVDTGGAKTLKGPGTIKIAQGSETNAMITVKATPKPPRRGEPVAMPFTVKYKTWSVPAAIRVVAPTAKYPTCKVWRDDKCIRCEVPFNFADRASISDIATESCPEMDPSRLVSVIFDADVTSVKSSSGTVWATFRLEAGGRSTECCGDSRAFPAHYQLKLAGLHASDKAPAEGVSKIVRCTSAGDTTCTGTGVLIFSQQ